jgi:erythromycin esterase
MARSIFKVWRTEEVLPLFELLRQTDADAPLRLAGFDPQYSSRADLATPLVRAMLTPLDAALAERLTGMEEALRLYYEEVGRLRRSRVRGTAGEAAVGTDGDPRDDYRALVRRVKAAKPRYTADCRQAQALLAQHRGRLEAEFGREAYLLVHRTFFNRMRLLAMLTVGLRRYMRIRDRTMADNLVWLKETLHPGEKIIVWAHNGHIAKNTRSLFGFQAMASLLPASLRKASYAIGLFMEGGRAAANDRNIYPIAEAPPGGLEAVMGAAGHRCCFLDLSAHGRRTAGNAWMHSAIPYLDWGRQPMILVPRMQYDGLILVRNVRPPVYLDE